jgi:hypothetical protein
MSSSAFSDSIVVAGEGVPDNILLETISEDALYENLTLRYNKDVRDCAPLARLFAFVLPVHVYSPSFPSATPPP